MISRTISVLLVSVALASSLGGCASTSKKPMAPSGENIAVAKQLADQGDAARRKGDNAEALRLYKESVAESGKLPHVWNNMGLILTEVGSYSEAVSAYSIAAQLSPTDPRPLTNIGLAYQKAGWAEDALDYYGRALDISPSHLPALRYAIVAAETLNRAEEVDIERIRRALLTETDAEWRTYFERQRFLFESRKRKLEESETYAD